MGVRGLHLETACAIGPLFSELIWNVGVSALQIAPYGGKVRTLFLTFSHKNRMGYVPKMRVQGPTFSEKFSLFVC